MSGRTVHYFGAFAAYVGALLLQGPLIALSASGPYKVAIALLPILPALYILFLIVKGYRRQDELQQRIVGEALTYSFCVVGFGSFAYGFLEEGLNYPHLPTIYIFPLLIMVYGAARFLIQRRYQ